MKNLLECVITDIIQSNHLNDEEMEKTMETHEQEVKRQIVVGFLDKYNDMMND